MIDQRHIQYDLNDYDLRPSAEIRLALVKAKIDFSMGDPGKKPKASMEVRHFDAKICPAKVYIHFNPNQFTRKKETEATISLSYDLGKCKTHLEMGYHGKLEANMYVLNSDIDKAKEIIEGEMHAEMKNLATIIKNVTTGIKSLSKETNEPTP